MAEYLLGDPMLVWNYTPRTLFRWPPKKQKRAFKQVFFRFYRFFLFSLSLGKQKASIQQRCSGHYKAAVQRTLQDYKGIDLENYVRTVARSTLVVIPIAVCSSFPRSESTLGIWSAGPRVCI